ncbi:type II toxin-antitoxin system PrlF family antitoxin [Pseudomonas vranovensis]|uniref:type II toxin-antitoxin system PrlF family antitoxin n=1 Tax=Pseudomonas vranovensis TaxID=321661 RepID=UPI003D99ED98
MNDSRAPASTAVSSFPGSDLKTLSEAIRDSQSVSLILNCLAADIHAHPEKLRAVDSEILSRIDSLIFGVDVDLNASLVAEDE